MQIGIIIVPPNYNICPNPRWSAISIPHGAIWVAEPIPWVGSCKRANDKSRICHLHRDSRYAELVTLAYTKLLTMQYFRSVKRYRSFGETLKRVIDVPSNA